MADNKEREVLLLRLMHLIGEKFRNQAVLKGGMCLRLLNSPRKTRDIDYIFTSKESRKVIADQIKKMIEKEGDINITDIKLNSRGIIMQLASEKIEVTLEISMIEKLNLSPQEMTTEALTRQYQMGPRIITVMSLAEAYANKIAASIERTTMRDLYDITVYQGLIPFDRDTLKKRLARVQIDRAKPKNISFKEAAELLRRKSTSLSQEDLERELSDLVPDTFMKGGLLIIKNSLNRLCQELESL